MARGEKLERLFKCTRCYTRFPVNVPAEDLPLVKCPRSCPAAIVDVTEETAELYKKLKEEHKRQAEARERLYAEKAAKAQEEAIALAKARNER